MQGVGEAVSALVAEVSPAHLAQHADRGVTSFALRE